MISPGVIIIGNDMNLQQLLQKCLIRWKEISGYDFCILDSRDQIYVTTQNDILPEKESILAFRKKNVPVEHFGSFSIYCISSEEASDYLLIVCGKEKPCGMTGELAVCQVESLFSAGSRKNDRNLIIQDILLGRFSSAEIYNQAKKIHLTPTARRIVLLIRTTTADTSVLEIIRNIFVNRSKDYVSALDESTVVVVHEMKENEDMEDVESISALIIDMLNTEVMTKAWVSYSNVCDDLTCLFSGYQEAMTALVTGRIFYAGRNVFGYSHLGIGRLLYQIPLETCELFMEEILGNTRARTASGNSPHTAHEVKTLDSLDEETMNIIRTFFENNLNLSETSRKLYVHRNTLVYRLEKIEKKYGLDIRTFEDALTFKIAMMVSDYINYKKKTGS